MAKHDNVEIQRLRDQLRGKAAVRTTHRASYTPSSSRSSGTSTSSSSGSRDLMSLMTNRLRKVEAENQKLKFQNMKLKDEASYLKSLGTNEDVSVLRHHIDVLRQQIFEMEAFLSDNGLIWVGDTSTGTTTEGGSSTVDTPATIDQKQSKAPLPSTKASVSPPPPQGWIIPSPEVIRKRVDELNRLVGADKPQIVRGKGGAKFQDGSVSGSISVAVFQDGIFIRRGPFRSFSDHSARQFLLDISDGFFPSEWAHQHPEGMAIDLVLKTEEKYGGSFTGKGQSADDSASSAPQVPKPSARPGPRPLGPSSMSAEEPMSCAAFLSRLPHSALVGSGRVVAVRSAVRDMVGGSGSGGSGSHHTPGVHRGDAAGVRVLSPVLKPGNEDVPLATLRAKVSGGFANGRSILLKLPFNYTLEDLAKRVAGELDVVYTRLSLKQPFGSDLESLSGGTTIKEAGLTPNARLIVVLGC
eukprot:gnl/Dysnectes_brevis/5940_a8846_374.p1 GENE.gnl/Dysnectes_brevis/5940_a8846_374~~gnl/Dysnectes_brevis/5940_a8846_374.p1  ORF type:complete len:501 (-),score=70.14 gnl/Dysnectes_brevis/5940_a8846_374:46-1449(-)